MTQTDGEIGRINPRRGLFRPRWLPVVPGRGGSRRAGMARATRIETGRMRWTGWRNFLMRVETPCQTPSLLARSGGRGLRIEISQAGEAGGHGIGADRREVERNAVLSNRGAQIRMEFDAEGRVREANDLACGVTNGLGDCLIGQGIGRLFGPNLIDQRPIAAVLRTLQKGAPVQGRFEMHPNEAGARIIEGSFTPVIGPEGAVRGILFLGAEVTDMDAGSDARTSDRAGHRRHGLGPRGRGGG